MAGTLSAALSDFKTISPEKAKLLEKYLNLKTAEDVLYFLPNRYVDKTRCYTIRELTEAANQEVLVKGVLSEVKEIAYGNNQKRLSARLTDGTGSAELVWFRYTKKFQGFLTSLKNVSIFGLVTVFRDQVSITHPELDITDEALTEKTLMPVYPYSEKLQKRGIDQKYLRGLTKLVLTAAKNLPDPLPDMLLEKYKLPGKYEALRALHYPIDTEEKKRAVSRLKLEEALLFFLIQNIRNTHSKNAVPGQKFSRIGAHFNDFYAHHLPFALTDAQKRVVKEIWTDMKSGSQMNRLLQGDVGSGKTIVALLSMLMALDNGCQACLMAPTEILAQQHYAGIASLLEPAGIPVALLTGSTPARERKILHEKLTNGTQKILIGTHALIEDTVQFKNLGLSVIDEQHRFGVAQRGRIWKKNALAPHILLMTATPIPRTLAMTYYADLDVSVIDELPKGRKPIITVMRKEADRYDVNTFILEELKKGHQIYFVFPLIEESEALGYRNVLQGYEEIQSAFPGYQVEMLHGGMASKDKDRAMQRFKNNEAQILVATTVIEVGVDVPNASLMLIENADKFGLAQLHQIRGRVGRGAAQSYCILMTEDKMSRDGRIRIKSMCETQDGFRLSEVDMQLRGAGDLGGTRQSGSVNFRILDLKEDTYILHTAKNLADRLYSKYPNLSHPALQELKKEVHRQLYEASSWSRIS